MNQQKIGCFLKELRREKSLTQEQLAEIMGVSARSVSRWETGTSMPDISILIQLSNYYKVDLKEILDGERENKNMDKHTEETVLKVTDYTNNEKIILTKRMHYIFIAGLAAFVVYMVLDISVPELSGVYEKIAEAVLGALFGILLTGTIFTSRYMYKIRNLKKKLIKGMAGKR